MKRVFLVALYCLVISTTSNAQNNKIENAILWKVSGNGLPKPSYIFGTYHFLTNAFVDTLPEVLEAYRSAAMVVGELIVDSSIQAPMMRAQMLQGTTLKKILPDTVYAKTSDWFKSEAGLDLIRLDQLNPMAVMTIAMGLTKQKYFPNKPGEVQLDTYFQEMGKNDRKQIKGLETIDVQIKALFGQLTLSRQIEILNEMVDDKDGLKNAITVMNDAYFKNDLQALQALMYGASYKPQEIKALLDDRNDRWMQQLPGLMQDQPLFVAVGALHLIGKTGLMNQLKEKGYKVTAVNLKD